MMTIKVNGSRRVGRIGTLGQWSPALSEASREDTYRRARFAVDLIIAKFA
jgi:hypothetical protein